MELANFNALNAILRAAPKAVDLAPTTRAQQLGRTAMLLLDAGMLDRGGGVRHFEKIDRGILSLFADRELHTCLIPVLIPGDVLARCGSFESFPHQLMAVATLYGDDRKVFADGGELRLQSFVVQDRYLTPAACRTLSRCSGPHRRPSTALSRFGLASTAARPILTRQLFGSRPIRFARSSLSEQNVSCARLSPTRRKQPWS